MLGHVFSEVEEELPSLAFLLDLHHSLLPWGLPQIPVPASGLVCTAGQRAQKTSQAPMPREWASAQAPWKLPSLESRLSVEAWLLLRNWRWRAAFVPFRPLDTHQS